MAEVVNLRAHRKAKDRQKKRAQADENAIRFGRSKTLKALEDAQAEKDRRALDAHRLEGKPE